MPPSLEYESLLSYCPRGAWSATPSVQMRNAEEWMKAIKSGSGPGKVAPTPYPVIARRMRELAQEDPQIGTSFAGSPAPVLVPVPRSSLPPQVEPYFWPARELARALVGEGLGGVVLQLLVRRRAVQKRALGGRRDYEEQVTSLGVTEPFPPDQPIVLVDDIVTSGSTLLGAMLCLQAAFPELSEVRAFAAMRTMSTAAEFTALRDPVRGTIIGRENRMARRRP